VRPTLGTLYHARILHAPKPHAPAPSRTNPPLQSNVIRLFTGDTKEPATTANRQTSTADVGPMIG
jgi:hypothetical protein